MLRDHELGYSPDVHLTPDTVARKRLHDYHATLVEQLQRFNQLLSRKSVEWAIGGPDVPGDPIRILHLADRYGGSYEALLEWAEEVREDRFTSRFRYAADILCRLADAPINRVNRFAEHFIAAVTGYKPTDIEKKWRLWPELNLKIDVSLAAQWNEAMRQL